MCSEAGRLRAASPSVEFIRYNDVTSGHWGLPEPAQMPTGFVRDALRDRARFDRHSAALRYVSKREPNPGSAKYLLYFCVELNCYNNSFNFFAIPYANYKRVLFWVIIWGAGNSARNFDIRAVWCKLGANWVWAIYAD